MRAASFRSPCGAAPPSPPNAPHGSLLPTPLPPLALPLHRAPLPVGASPSASPVESFGLAAASPSPVAGLATTTTSTVGATSSIPAAAAPPSPVQHIQLPALAPLDLQPPGGWHFEAEAQELLQALEDFAELERKLAQQHKEVMDVQLQQIFSFPPASATMA